jgi:hypothetical protein
MTSSLGLVELRLPIAYYGITELQTRSGSIRPVISPESTFESELGIYEDGRVDRRIHRYLQSDLSDFRE